MRNMWLGLVLAGAAGCSSQAVNFEHQSELEVNTRGVELDDSGGAAVAGMFGTTCRVAVSDASVGEDYDFPTDNEEVQDAGILNGEDAVLVQSDLGAHLTYPDRVWDWSTEDFGTTGVVEGRIFDDGVALLTDDGNCHVEWQGGDTDVSVDMPADLCVGGSSFTVAPDGQIFVANGGEIVTATAEGSEGLGADAELVVWDDAAQVLYTAFVGDSVMTGLEADGTVRWTTDLDGAVVSFDAMGPLGSAAVMVEKDNGTGALLTVDGFTGDVTSSLATPSAAEEVEVSSSGDSLALVLNREVHFFNVRQAP